MAFPPDVYIGNGDEDSRFLNIYANPHMSISSTIRRSLMHNADEKAELFSVHTSNVQAMIDKVNTSGYLSLARVSTSIQQSNVAGAIEFLLQARTSSHPIYF
jgi:hypothetical protein